jgi:hypothetical protein
MAAMDLARLDWDALTGELDERGSAVARKLLSAKECADLARLYSDEARFRSRVVMARHGFGSGEYKYFAYPLPSVVEKLRTALYPRLAGVANRWHERLGQAATFPAELPPYLKKCHRAGQARPTPLLLKYGAGDYNCLHQDLYGELVFPIQATILLSAPGEDFTGGEFILAEQRPRLQSRVEVVPLRRGDLVLFCVHHRPVRGRRGWYRTNMRHGVSRLQSGRRYTLGVIFHDAK